MIPRLLRLLAAILLVAEAILTTHPVLMVYNFFNGAGILGKAVTQVRVVDVFGQGLAYVAGLLIALLLLMAAWGVAHTTRGIGALLLQPTVLAFATVPFLRPMTAAPSAVLLLVAVACVGLLIIIIGTGEKDPGTHRRWWWLAVFAAAVTGLALVGAGSRSFPYDPVIALAPKGETVRASGERLPAMQTEQNPSLQKNPFNSIHNDSAATDTYDLRAPANPQGADVETLFTGGDCSTVTFDSRGRLITLCSTLTKVLAYIVDPQTLEVIDSQAVGDRQPDLTDFSGGGYFVLDDKDRIVFPARGGRIVILDTATGIALRDSFDVSGTLRAGEQVTSVMPDWQGRYWYVGSDGTVGLVRRGGRAESLNLDGEDIENSLAITRDGAYIVTGAALYRFVAGPDGPPVVAWRTAYERGNRQKPGQTSRASGTTPTVFGDWVAITDNADPRMKIVVANRLTGDVLCEVPVFGPDAGADENSLIAIGNVLIAENNYGYAPPISSVMRGRTTAGGLAAIEVDATGCAPKWSNDDIHIPSLVSKATTRDGLVLTYTKPANEWGVDAWYFTGVDATTGEELWTRLAGTGTIYNNHYAAAYLSPEGDMFVGTVNGLAVLRNSG